MSDEVVLPEGQVSNAVLLTAVKQLVRAVEGLDRTLKADYPKREEFRRSRRYAIYAVIVALILSFFANVTTVNYCFLQGVPDQNSHRFCHVFPGYDESFDNNRKAIKEYRATLDLIRENQNQIKELQRQINSK